ncbi:hypothetical protein F2Q69_00038057 [Brassica cretica]|uniref:Uncharacterized protein n=1 Tax=Brassica cretica TaxID=69181 RepID=A0A8S9SQS8_BRACR|nr:hypothetical protein F2Q69_00038057 [Brassica cretica]
MAHLGTTLFTSMIPLTSAPSWLIPTKAAVEALRRSVHFLAEPLNFRPLIIISPSSSRSLKSENPSSGPAPPVPEALLLSPFPCFQFSFFFLVSTFADMFVSLRSMGASRFVYQRGKLWRSLEKRRGNGKAEKKEVTARDGLRHLLQWVSSSPRGGETTGEELVGLWSEACLSVLGNIMYLDLCVWFLAEDRTSNSCGMRLSRERAFGEDAFESRSSSLIIWHHLLVYEMFSRV